MAGDFKYKPDTTMAADLKETLRNTLSNLKVADFKGFKHYLLDKRQITWNQLENADRYDVVDLMVQVYSMEAGGIMVTILQKIKHNQLAMDLERDLTKLRGEQYSPGLAEGGGGINVDAPAYSRGMEQTAALGGGGVSGPLIVPKCCSVLSHLESEQVQSKSTAQEQNQTLMDMLEKKGAGAQDRSHDPPLVEDLQSSAVSPAVPEPQQGGAQRVTKVSLKLKLQEHIRKNCAVIHQESGVCSLQDMYTELHVVEGRTGGVNTEHEVATIDMRQIGARPSSEDEQVKLADMFTANSGTRVLTLGIAGAGKTVAVKKFVMDWAEDKSNQDIDFVFVFLFRELNLKKEKCFNLLGLLLSFYPDVKGLKNFPEFFECKILFIFDGFDESTLELDFKEWISEPDKESTVEILITSLIKGKLLSSALIWVTTRPAAASLIPDECFNLMTEVRGFNDNQIIKFFQKNIKDIEKAKCLTDHIKKNRSLHIMCHIPVFCRIIASVQYEILRDESKGKAAITLTEMYTLYNVSQIRRMNDKFFDGQMNAEEKGKFLVLLGKLAFEHLEQGTLIFYEKDLQKCDIDAISGALQAGVCTQIFSVDSAATGEKIFSFVHLSVQEFLAALYFLHEKSQRTSNHLVKTLMEKISWGLRHSTFDLFSSAVEKALHSENGQFDLFVRFLLGLAPMLKPGIRSSLHVLLPDLCVREESINKIVQYIKEKIRKEDISSERIINLFHCLNELGDNSLVDEINRYINSADEEKNLTPAQCSALAYLLLMSTEDLEMLDLKKYLRSEEGLRRMLPAVKVSTRVWLNRCYLSKVSCQLLAPVLQRTPSHLRELDMSDNDLQDEGVELLCLGLRDPQCKLETLRLSHCDLSKTSCKSMASVLQRTPSYLRELDMSENDLQDEGVELLCVGLRDPQCKLEILRLSYCIISKKGCSLLSSALKSNPSYMEQLDLNYNHPEVTGVRELTARLNDPSCKLKSLRYDHGGQFRIKSGPKKYACELTLDPNTANIHLYLSEGNRKVDWKPPTLYPDHPERFDSCEQVLCREGLSGRCYWEAEWSDGGAQIAVAYKSMQRKGESVLSRWLELEIGNADCVFGRNDKSWSLNCTDNSYSAWHNDKKTAIPAPSSGSSRVGVYLDWSAGTLSFYSVSSDTLTHLHTFHSTFTEPLYPGFGFGLQFWFDSKFSVFLCQVT
ncbi:NACHT, LRR and PYD domains-containing protein 3-like [Alosa pseudoharengus]|uniref:NACHT, LRR and PYD domains-containing protein 3-like n=1 Tax=Alosa pseudoharengus TaxID=34774 RepID=UPI003F890CC7